MDVIADLPYPLPVTVIQEMLGLPPGDRDRPKQWSDDFVVYFSKDVSQITEAEYRKKAAPEAI